MARKITAVAFVIFLLVICFIGQSMIRSNVNSLLKQVETIEEMTNNGDIEAAIEQEKNFLKKWDKSEKILSILIPHSEIDNINIALEQAISYLNSRETKHFFAQSAELKKLLKHLIENEKVNLQNIL